MAKIVTVTKKEDDEVLLPMGQKNPFCTDTGFR